MNYIPGFSNYLQTAIPRYARGGSVMDGEPMMYDMDRYGEPMMYDMGGMLLPAAEPAAQPMTQEPAPAAGGLSYEDREARRIAANTPPPGTSIVGPYAGKKGLSFGDDNTFDIYDEQEVRVVDGKGNVIFSGVGVDGANRAVAVAQSLSNDLGKNANFRIQKAERTLINGSAGPDRYIDVAYAAPSQSGLGFLADTVLPFAATFIPGVGPVLGAALGSAASSAAQGRGLEDALKRAAIAGGSAYVGGQVFGPASSTAGSTAGSVAGSTAGSAAGSVADDVINVIGPNLVGSTLGSTIGSGLSSVTGYKTPAEKFAQQPSPVAEPMAVAPEVPYDGIRVIGPKLASASGAPFAAGFPVPVEAMLSGAFNAAQPLPQQQPTAQEPTAEEPTAEDIEAAKNPINVIGGGLESLTPDEILLALGSVGGLAAATAGGGAGASSNVVDGVDQANGDIVVSKARPYLSPEKLAEVMASGVPTSLLPDNFFDPPSTDGGGKKLGVEDYLSIAGKILPLLGAGGGSGQTGTYGGGGTGRLNPIFSAKLPSAGGLGTIGATRTARPLGDQDWLTYGTRPELNFFDYAPRAALPTPVTTPMPGNPAGPIMNQNDPMRFAKGGKAKGGLSYEELSPEEKNFVDYHRRSLLVNPYERDGNISTVVGAVNEVPEGEMLYPTYVHGKMMDPNSARDWALRSGIDFPVYPDAETALARERMIHDNIIEPETARYAQGERKFLQERAKGGRTEFAVNGPGTGRSDDIPAVLSDGEYVIDAETVALLGDGSSKAGAKKLDDLRVKVRKHKGQKLAKGRFSANAKKPEAYLSGGRI